MFPASDPLAQLKALGGPSKDEVRSIRRDLARSSNTSSTLPVELEIDITVAHEALVEVEKIRKQVDGDGAKLRKVANMLGEATRARRSQRNARS